MWHLRRVPQSIRWTLRVLVTGALRPAKRTRQVDIIRWRSVASYADLLGERWPSVLWLHEPAVLSPNSSLLFPQLANEEIREYHFRIQPCPTSVGLACLRDTLVSGSSLVGNSSVLYRLGPLTPLYVDEQLSRDFSLNN